MTKRSKAAHRRLASWILADVVRLAAVQRAAGKKLAVGAWLAVGANILSSAPPGRESGACGAPERFGLTYEHLFIFAERCRLSASADDLRRQVAATLAWRAAESARIGRPHHVPMSPDTIGKLLGVTEDERRAAGARNIGTACGSREAREAAARERNREREAQRRRKAGAVSREEYEAAALSRSRPWEQEGVSRRTWERRRGRAEKQPETAVASPCVASPCVTNKGAVASPCVTNIEDTANAIGEEATATGANSQAEGKRATATGQFARALGGNATASGQFSTASGENATAIGQQSAAYGEYATAVGQGSVATGATASAFGQNANAAGDGATALGQNASATANNSTAVGAGANTAGYVNATAIGAGATNTAANQMMFGGVTTTYAAPGITSAASRAAQSGATNFVTSDGNGNLATSDYGPGSIAGLSGAVNGLGMNVAGIWQSVGNLQRSVRRGYEGSAVAIANTAPTISRDARFGVSAKWGNFRGENAFGAMAQVRLNPNIVINGSLAVGLRYGGVGGGVGGLYEW